jgi:hypothetical protein
MKRRHVVALPFVVAGPRNGPAGVETDVSPFERSHYGDSTACHLADDDRCAPPRDRLDLSLAGSEGREGQQSALSWEPSVRSDHRGPSPDSRSRPERSFGSERRLRKGHALEFLKVRRHIRENTNCDFTRSDRIIHLPRGRRAS